MIIENFENLLRASLYSVGSHDEDLCTSYKLQLAEYSKLAYSELIGCGRNLFINIVKSNFCEDPLLLRNFSALLKDCFGEDSLLISDYYVALSLVHENHGLLEKSLEFVGKALVIRVEREGVISNRTAESHFIFGALLFKKDMIEDAKREMYSSRAIYVHLFGENSKQVSNCDFYLGQLEQRTFHFERTYLFFYKSFHTRYLLEGKESLLTKSSELMLISSRKRGEVRFFCGLELKNRIVELGWNQTSQGNYKYVISLFIFRLSDDAVLTNNQLQLLLSAATKFFSSNFAALSMNSNVQVSPEEIQLILSVPTTPVTSNKFELKEVHPFQNLTDHQIHQPPIPQGLSNLPVISAREVTPSSLVTTSKAPEEPGVERGSPEKLVIESTKEAKLPVTSISDRNLSVEESKGSLQLITSPKVAIPKTWRPIPVNSPLRQGRIHDLELQKIKSLLNSATNGLRFCRNEEGALLMVTPCSPKLLSRYLRHRMILFSLFAWYSHGHVTSHLRTKPPPKSTSTASTSTSAKSFPSSALNALLSSRNNPTAAIPPSLSKPASASSAAKTEAVFAANCPRPPPLPSSWPPIPFTKEDHEREGAMTPSPSKTFKSKYRAINLPTLPEIEGTFWSEAPQFSVSPQELFDDFEEEFNTAVKRKVPSVALKSPTKQKKGHNSPETALDPPRAQNISIMLAKFGKRPIESIAKAIEDFEPTALGPGAVSSLMQFIPNPEDVSKVLQFIRQKAGNSSATGSTISSANQDNELKKKVSELSLGKVEQYIFYMSQIPKLEKRLQTMSQILCAAEVSQNIRAGAEILISASHEMRGSERLKFVLRTFLDLNNTIQQSNQNSEVAKGFKLSSWRKLSQTKLNSGETAQNYAIAKMLRHVPESLDLMHDMPTIEESRGINLARLHADLKKLEECLQCLNELTEEERSLYSDGPTAPRPVLANLQKYRSEIGVLFEESSKFLSEATRDFQSVCQYYGEASPPMDPELFFGEALSLIKSVQATLATHSSKHRRRAVAP